MNKFDSKKIKNIFNIGRGTLHYYNTQKCPSSRIFSPNDTNLKFYENEDEAVRDNQTHLKKCKKCFNSK